MHDFANSRYWRGTDQPTETLNNFDDLFTWIAAANALDAQTVDALRASWSAGDKNLAETIALREALYRIFTAIAAHAPPATRDIELFNGVLTAAPARAQLVTHDGAGTVAYTSRSSAGGSQQATTPEL